MKRSSFLSTTALGPRSSGAGRLVPALHARGLATPSCSSITPLLRSATLARGSNYTGSLRLRRPSQLPFALPIRRHASSATAATGSDTQAEESGSVSSTGGNLALIKETSDLFYQQLFVAKDERAAFHLYKILGSLTKNRAFVVEFGQKEGGRAIEQLFVLFKDATTHYAQEKILAVLGNLAVEEVNRRIIAEKGAEELRKTLASQSTLRNVLAQAVRLLNITLESKSQLPSSLFDGYVEPTMDLMRDFSDKPDLQLQLIRLLGLLSTDCSPEDYKRISPLGAAMLVRNLQAYIFESLESPFIAAQMTETLQAIRRILSRRPSGEQGEQEQRLAKAFQNTFLEHDSRARYAVLNGLNCVLLVANHDGADPALKQLATEVVDLLCRDNAALAAEVTKIRSSSTTHHQQ